MTLTKHLHRFYLHTYRYRSVAIIASILFAIVVLTFGIIYPGEEGIEGYISAFAMIAALEVENPGFYVWLIFNNSLALGLYISLVGIFLGVNLMPIADKDGKELLLSTPKSLTSNFLENSIVATIILALVLLPSFIIQFIFLYLNDSMDVAENATIIIILAFFLGFFMIFLTGFGTSLKFSKAIGYTFGGLYFALSFLADLTANTFEDFEFLHQISMYSQAKVTESAFNGEWNVNFIIQSIILVISLIIISLFILYRKDHLEGGTRGSQMPIEEEIDEKKSSKVAIIRKPMDKIISKLGWRFPIIRDQLHSSAGTFTIFICFTVFFVFYITSMFTNEEELAEILVGFDLPAMRAAFFGYSIQPNVESYIAMEIFAFAWAVFGIFLLIVINDLINRDKKHRYAEFTWAFPKNGTQILFRRTIAVLIYYIIIFLTGFILFLPMQAIVGINIDIEAFIVAYLLFIWSYCIFLVFFLSITLLLPYRHSQKTLIFSYFISVLVLLVAFMSDLEWLRYLTPFGYFNTVGLMLSEVTLIEIIPEVLVCSVITLGLYVYVLKNRVTSRDYLL